MTMPERSPEKSISRVPAPSAIDHRILAALVTRSAIDRYHQAIRLREEACRLFDEADAKLDIGDTSRPFLDRKATEQVAYFRVLQWQKWRDLVVWAETTAEREAIRAIRAWDAAYKDSLDLSREPTGWPSRAVVMDGRFYLAVAGDPDDGGGADRHCRPMTRRPRRRPSWDRPWIGSARSNRRATMIRWATMKRGTTLAARWMRPSAG
jgi:hypothetical protein